MTPERWRRITAVFDGALALDPENRDSFIETACSGDATLREEVKALLEAHRNSAGFGDHSLAGVVVPGMMLGSYRVEHPIGIGGMGVVWRAYDTRLYRPVALKVIEASIDSDTARSRILREARSAAALTHPNICTIHEVGDVDGTPFLAMEYVNGTPLSDRLAHGALPLAEAIDYAVQAADALAYAHENGVIHRDFKAGNVIVGANGLLKIVDFGLARRTDALMTGAATEGTLARAGVAAGTPYVMAPEQVRGDDTDARTDVWSLGVMLYETVAGTKPFDAPTTAELFSSILRDSPAPLPDAVPEAMKAVMGRCLEKEPLLRFQSAREVHAALEAIQRDPSVVRTRRPRVVARQAWVVLAASAALVTSMAVVANDALRNRLFRGASLAPQPIRLAVLPFENLTGDPSQDYFSDGLTEEMIAQLGRIQTSSLATVGRTSTLRYKNMPRPIDQIGRELGVDYVLEGSARREGTRVRITAQLVRARDQTQVWADSFERELSSILAVQSEVTRGVARSLAITLIPNQETRLVQARIVNPEAYEAYLKGRERLYKVTSADFDTALRYFEMALEKDPEYAVAYTGIAAIWTGRQQFRFASPQEATPKARTALDRALALDSALPEAHYRLAVIKFSSDWDWDGADREFRAAIDLNPNYPDPRATYSHLLNIRNRPAEALAQIQRALQLDPFNTQFKAFYGTLLVQLQRYDDAIAQYDEVLRAVPNHTMALNGRRQALYHKGMYKEAVDAERAVWSARNDREMVSALDRRETDSGYEDAWRRAADVLATRARMGQAAPFDVWMMYLRAGNRQRAMDWLERGLNARDPNMIYIGVAPIYETLQSDARYQDLLRRMQLTR